MDAPTQPLLHVCITCRGGRSLAPDEAPLGQVLYETLAARLAAAPAPVTLSPVACLANCERGCSAAIAMSGKWTNLLGFLEPALAGDLLIYATAYAASARGTVMPSRRPASLSRLVVGRVPAPDAAPARQETPDSAPARQESPGAAAVSPDTAAVTPARAEAA